jgi:hypothetical protein
LNIFEKDVSIEMGLLLDIFPLSFIPLAWAACNDSLPFSGEGEGTMIDFFERKARMEYSEVGIKNY